MGIGQQVHPVKQHRAPCVSFCENFSEIIIIVTIFATEWKLLRERPFFLFKQKLSLYPKPNMFCTIRDCIRRTSLVIGD